MEVRMKKMHGQFSQHWKSQDTPTVGEIIFPQIHWAKKYTEHASQLAST